MRFLAMGLWACLGVVLLHGAWSSTSFLLPGAYATGPSTFSLGALRSWTMWSPTAFELGRPDLDMVSGAQAMQMLVQATFQLLLLLGSLLLVIRVVYVCFHAALASMPRTVRIAHWTLRSALAYRQLMSVYPDHDADEFVEKLVEAHTHWATRLAAVCRANGGVYVKFGQFACSFGAVPREYRAILSQLEDKARPRPFKEIERYLLTELGAERLLGPPGSGAIFTEFEKSATAAASLAQVHHAVLANGEEVAVKLQYPNLHAAVSADMTIVKALARITGYLFPDFRLGWLCDEMEAKLKVELDFRNEVHNANLLRAHLGHSTRLNASVPIIHEELSTPRMIVMEWVNGIKLTAVEQLTAAGVDPRSVGLALVRLFAELTFVYGYVHGDPHPGNLMVRAVGGERRFLAWLLRRPARKFEIVLLDHGTYLSMPQALREQFCQLWCSFAAMDKRMSSEVSTALAGERAGRILPALLTHQTRTRKEEIALQRSVGVNNFGDMAAILSAAPRDLVELLRINTVIRSSSNMLGILMPERKRIFAWYARKGLPRRGSSSKYVHSSTNSIVFRLRLLLVLSAWSGWSWAMSTAGGAWGLVLGFFGDVLFGD